MKTDFSQKIKTTQENPVITTGMGLQFIFFKHFTYFLCEKGTFWRLLTPIASALKAKNAKIDKITPVLTKNTILLDSGRDFD